MLAWQPRQNELKSMLSGSWVHVRHGHSTFTLTDNRLISANCKLTQFLCWKSTQISEKETATGSDQHSGFFTYRKWALFTGITVFKQRFQRWTTGTPLWFQPKKKPLQLSPDWTSSCGLAITPTHSHNFVSLFLLRQRTPKLMHLFWGRISCERRTITCRGRRRQYQK